jgi:hypothetical protein
VQIEVSNLTDTLTQCTCSICRRVGALWVFHTRKTARVLSKPEAENSYTWNEKTLEFYHCKTCGCITRYESIEKSDDSRIAVNARMLRAEAVAGIRVRTFDGAHTWKYVD